MLRAACLSVVVGCGAPPASWSVPPGWRGELIAFPLDFAPSLPQRGVEEIRFAPGFFDPAAPGYWSYAFVWRLDTEPAFDATSVAAQLTIYFRGLIDAVDDKHEIASADRDSIAVRAVPVGPRLDLAAHIVDAFASKQPLELTGSVTRLACARGAVWVFVLAPARSRVRAELDQLAARVTCEQRPRPNR